MSAFRRLSPRILFRVGLVLMLVSGNLAAIVLYQGELPQALRDVSGGGRALASESAPTPWTDPPTSQELLSMELGELAAFVAGLGRDDAAGLTNRFDALADLPPEYRHVARTTLLGAAEAKLHQAKAMAAMDAAQREALLDSLDAPGRPARPQGLDHGELDLALHELQEVSAKVLTILEHHGQKDQGFAAALTQETGILAGAVNPPSDLGPALADLAGVALDPQVAKQLDALPKEVQAAVSLIVAAAPGLGEETVQGAISFAAAVDAARPALEMWAALTLVQKQYGPPPLPSLPDPDAAGPPLRWNLPAGTPPEPLDIETAMRVLSQELGVPIDARDLDRANIPEQQAAPIGTVLHAAARYVAAARAAAEAPGSSWSGAATLDYLRHYEGGTIPSPGSYEAIELIAELPRLEAEEQRRQALADLLAAVEDAVAQLAIPASMSQASMADPPCDAEPCDAAADALAQGDGAIHEVDGNASEATRPGALSSTPACDGPDAPSAILVGPILALDLCGIDSDWSVDVMLSIDVGGNDNYTHRAGAPFTPDPVAGEAVPPIPLSIVLDLGGNDTYDAGGRPCSQGSACQNGTSPSPVGILVDWDGDHTTAENRFLAGDRSQGHGGYGVLVERVGRESELSSTYVAGRSSQGVAAAGGVRTEFAEWASSSPQAQANATRAAPVGGLIRLAGSGSFANSTFHAGDSSQAHGDAVSTVSVAPATALFLNMVGEDGISSDTYVAGRDSQASAAQAHGVNAVFADIGGPGSVSNDFYAAGTHSRGHTGSDDIPRALFGTYELFTAVAPVRQHVLFLDAVVPTPEAPAEPVEGPIDVEDGRFFAEGRPGLTYRGSSNDTYRGQWDQGHGWSRAFFVDLGGQDDYDPAGPDGPTNDAKWNNRTEADTGLQSADSPCLQPPGVPACGFDLGAADRDGDGIPAALEIVWRDFVGLWQADDGDPGASPLPTPPVILIDTNGTGLRAEDLNHSYAVVLSLGSADEHYESGFSAALHIDSGGNDRYDGRPGAAGMHLALAEERLDHAQHPFSALIDLGGDDRYISDLSHSQGFGGGGATGLLLDARGSDAYIADSHAQGVGELGGLGVLVDAAARGNNDHNLFRAAGPSKGASAGELGGIGILVANGAHNTFDDGETPLGARGEPGGASVNLGENGAASIQEQIVVTSFGGTAVDVEELEVDLDYTFQATVEEPEGDDVTVCWTIEYWNESLEEPGIDARVSCTMRLGQGQGADFDVDAAFRWNETFQVPTDAGIDGISESYPFNVELAVTDSGQATTIRQWEIRVANEPPIVAAPAPPVTSISRTATFAVQPSLAPSPDLDGMAAKVSIGGDVEPSLGCWAAHADPVQCIDWADVAWGARLRWPESSGATSEDDLENAIDGEPETLAILDLDPALHAIIDLGQPRAIHAVELLAQNSFLSDVILSMEGLRPDGTTAFFGTVSVPHSTTAEPFSLTLPGESRLQPYKAIVLRQLVDEPESDAALGVFEVRALGPGFSRAWDQAGDIPVTYSVVDAFGGRAEVDFVVGVDSSQNQETDAPTTLLDLVGRGPVRHVTVATAAGASQEYALRVTSPDSGSKVRIEWGDGISGDCLEADEDLKCTHAWQEPGDYLVQAFLEGQETRHALAWVHVEEALDVWVVDPQGGVNPVMFLALGEGKRSWHVPWENPVAGGLLGGGDSLAGYALVVDAGGDDRYIDRAAATRVPLAAGGQNLGGVPALLVDAQGDDDYISSVERTQAFASNAGAALLVDAAGDDLYVAPGRAQGAAVQGAAMLLDMEGDDVFFGGPPSALGADALMPGDASLLSKQVPRSGQTDVWRAPLTLPEASFLQGAAEEGVGILAATGGLDVFVAGSMAQGYGQHDPRVLHTAGYGSPNPQCMPPLPAGPQSPPCQADKPDDPQKCTQEEEASGDDNMWCFIGVGLGGSPPSCSPPGTAAPICDYGISTFPTAGPRYGSSMGLLLRSDGPSMYALGSSGQGASAADARGFLMDLGGFIAQAGSDAQAYTRGGQAALVAPGAHATWVESGGHGFTGQPEANPEGVDAAGSAQYFGAPSTSGCVDECGQPTSFGESTGPALTWIESPQGTSTGDAPFKVGLDGEAPFEVVAFTQPLAPSSLDPGECTKVPLGPPVLIAHQRELQEQIWEFSIEHERLGDGPRYVAGCHATTVLAREAADERPSAWSGIGQEILLLPPPAPRLDGWVGTGLPEIVVGTDATDIILSFDEPLVLHGQQPQVSIIAIGDPPPKEFAADPQGWQGAELPFAITPPTLPGQQQQAEYALCVVTSWTPESPSACEAFATLVVDTGAPEVVLATAPVEEGGWWKATRPLDVRVRALDGSRVESVQVRMVMEDCEVDCLVKLADGPGASHELGMVAVPGSSEWKATVLPSDVNFDGGDVRIEAKATDQGDITSDWMPILSVGMDLAPPAYVTHSSSAGTDATNQPFPIGFTVTYEDCGNKDGDCVPGAGLDASKAVAFIRPEGTSTLIPLSLAGAQGDSAVSFEWDGEGVPSEAHYQVILQAEDQTGNLLVVNPGVPFTVDRTPPEMTHSDAVPEPRPRITLPADQSRLKPGDLVDVSVLALDLGTAPSGIHEVAARFEDSNEEWLLVAEGPDAPGIYSNAAVKVPDDASESTSVVVMARDAAGNTETVTSGAIQVDATAPGIDVTVTPRPRSLRLIVETTHETQVVEASVKAGPTERTGSANRLQPTLHQVDFTDLAPQTAYEVQIVVRDPAGHQVSEILQQVFTTVDIETEIVPNFIPPLTFSGEVEISGRILQVPEGTGILRLVTGTEAQQIIAQEEIDLSEPADDVPFSFAIDSMDVFPDSTTAALDAVLQLEFDDGINAVSVPVEIRIDNAPPNAEPRVDGKAHNGWYNHSVEVHAGSSDDTNPIAHEARIGESIHLQRSLRISEDGVHAVIFELTDAANPPNIMETAPLEVRIDRTPPDLELEVAEQATRHVDIDIAIDADDPTPGSGVAQFRVGSDGWGEWTETVPTEATLAAGPDGQRWIRVAVRDEAGNVRQASHGVLLDRAPPEILALSWIGRDAEDAPVLRVVADDATSHVVDARFATATGWTPWHPTNGLDALALPASALLEEGLLQVRDAAGNVADAELPEIQDVPVSVESAESSVVAEPEVAPKHGDTHTRFAFTAMVRLLEGQPPSNVWLEIGQTLVPMLPAGTPADGAQMYAASTRLPATHFDQPHQFTVTAVYGAIEQSTGAQTGPLVAAAGNALAGEAPAAKESPMALPVLACAIAAAMQARRRRRL